MPETQWYPEGQEPFKQGMISWLKLCRILKPVPLVLTANTVPLPEPPPPAVVPYRVSPAKINPATGSAPSLGRRQTLRPVAGSVTQTPPQRTQSASDLQLR